MGNRVAAIVLAAGSSQRMGFDKLWVDVAGRPLIAWSMAAFAQSGLIDRLVVVVGNAQVEQAQALLDELSIEGVVVRGGAERQDSVRAGLDAAPQAEWVVVHDAARPRLTSDLVARGLAEGRETGAAIAAIPVVDTIKQVQDGQVVATPERSTLWAAQTPQVFRRTLLKEAHDAAGGVATDDAALVEAIGGQVRVFMGSYDNIKVTTSADLHLVRLLMAHNGAGLVTQ